MMQSRSIISVRKRSDKMICGIPLYDIAFGPDPQKGEFRGRAQGMIAIGDIAVGWLAVGGVAHGFIALGGVAFGVIAMGGVAMGLIGIGGLAVGVLALGGAAMGYYAYGDAAWGQHVISSVERSPEAVAFFKFWLPTLK